MNQCPKCGELLVSDGRSTWCNGDQCDMKVSPSTDDVEAMSDQERQHIATLEFIKSHPTLQSLLYDLSLGPTMVDRGTYEYGQMQLITYYWQQEFNKRHD